MELSNEFKKELKETLSSNKTDFQKEALICELVKCEVLRFALHEHNAEKKRKEDFVSDSPSTC